MDFYILKIAGIERKLPIIALGPKIKVASLNLLGDTKLVKVLAESLAEKIRGIEFDYLVGPEVKVVPILHELSETLKKEKYIVCRKEIHGYMVSPVKSRGPAGLVIDGVDAKLIKGKKVVIVDDVVSSGRTMKAVEQLMEICSADVVAEVAVFRQGDRDGDELSKLMFVGSLPVFTNT